MNEPQSIPRTVELLRTPSHRKGQEYALVLRAVGIDHELRREGPTSAVYVLERDAQRAFQELERYERENRGWPPRAEMVWRASDWVAATVVYALVLVVGWTLSNANAFGLDWYARGAARAELIRSGELWRTVTALTLHANAAHLLGNIFFGAFFGAVLAQSLGAGAAWLLVVLAAACANFANAWLQGPRFSSIGASTAVFAALGAQVAWQWRMRKRLVMSPYKRWGMLLAGVFLLAYLGVQDPRQQEPWMQPVSQRVDVAGHALGFVCGAALGWLAARGPRGIELGSGAQIGAGAAAIGIIALGWWLAASLG